jgi:hypothetical protein
MTANRDLKRRVRDRQAQTGESYMSALHHVLAQRPGSIPSAIPTVEFVEVTEVAAALGLKCRISVSPTLVHAIEVEQTLERFRDTLVAAGRDPALLLMQSVALYGEHVYFPVPAPAFHEVQDVVRFVERVLAGLGGPNVLVGPSPGFHVVQGAARSAERALAGLGRVSGNGRMLALRAVPRAASSAGPPASERSQPAMADQPIAVFSPWSVPTLATVVRPPLLVVNTLDEVMPAEILERFRTELP